MSLFLPPTASNMAEWVRKVSAAVNTLLRARETPFLELDTAPTNPGRGQAYYDTTTNKVRIWNGSAWNDLW
jgi:hypothetical protein